MTSRWTAGDGAQALQLLRGYDAGEWPDDGEAWSQRTHDAVDSLAECLARTLAEIRLLHEDWQRDIDIRVEERARQRARADAAEAECERLRAGEGGVIDLGTQAMMLRDLLREVRPFVDPDATAVVDELARRFYRDTGIMAPGKSVPLEMASSQPPNEERRSLYRDWLQAHRDAFVATIDAALGESPP